MNTFAVILAAIPVVVVSYAYLIYPLVLFILSRLRAEPTRRAEQPKTRVSVVIPAYNEESQIAAAIDAVLSQDIPQTQVDILVISDASTDGTDRIVEGYAARGVELMRMPERSGKTKAENIATARLAGNIIVNTDASVRLHPSAIRELVASMSDPTVGVASSRDVSVSRSDQWANVTEAGYVGYEMWVRELETQTGGIVGASGSCYAIRADLHKIPVPDDLSRDFGAALTARAHGFRSVSVRDAICFVPRTGSLRREYGRKVRTISRGIDTLWYHRALLGPRYGLFAFKLFSHKVCRWLAPVSLIFGVVGIGILAETYLWARGLLAAGSILTVVAFLGAMWPFTQGRPRIASAVAFAVSGNLAVLHAIWRLFAGHDDHIWEPTRREG